MACLIATRPETPCRRSRGSRHRFAEGRHTKYASDKRPRVSPKPAACKARAQAMSSCFASTAWLPSSDPSGPRVPCDVVPFIRNPMSSPATKPAISSRPVADWATVGVRLAHTRRAAGLEPLDLARKAGVDVDDLARQEAGEPLLDSFDLQAIAVVLETTTGAWFYGDERAMFRGSGNGQAARAAEDIGRRLMSEFLATQAVCG